MVRCAKCANSWHQIPVEEVDEEPVSTADTDAVESDVSPETAESDPAESDPGESDSGEDQDETSDTEAEDDAAANDTDGDEVAEEAAEPGQDDNPGGAAVRRARARADRTAERQAGDGARKAGLIGWLVLAVVLFGIGGAGWFYQQKIVEFWPPAGQLFALIGLTSDAEEFGLAIQNVKWEHKRQKGQPVLIVLGEVTNTSDKPQAVPRLRVVVRDEQDRRLFRWTVTTALNNLQPGQITKFSTRLANPPKGARSLAVAFQLSP